MSRSQADPLVQLLEVLRKPGSITEEEYKELKDSAATPAPQFKSFQDRLIEQDYKIDKLSDDLTSQAGMNQKLSENFQKSWHLNSKTQSDIHR